ncbi:ribosomal RNA processing protein 36 homolog [Fagus crenata]
MPLPVRRLLQRRLHSGASIVASTVPLRPRPTKLSYLSFSSQSSDEILDSVTAAPPSLSNHHTSRPLRPCHAVSPGPPPDSGPVHLTGSDSVFNSRGKRTTLIQRLKMKKPDFPVANSRKTKFEDSDEHESSPSEDEVSDEHKLSSSEDEEEEEIERELADVTFEQLQKARSDGSHSVYKKPNQEKKSGRANKNRPMEASCKKPVGRLREVVQVPKKVVRDPRFESLCGTYDDKQFRSKYSFLFKKFLPDEIKEEQEKLDKSNDPYAINRFKHSVTWMRGNLPAERETLRKQLAKSNDPEIIVELKKNISWIDKQLKSESGQRTGSAILAEHKKKEREAAKKGKQPFYLSKSAIRQQRLIEKYENLKASGKLDAFIEKRRKKNAAKDHRYMPYRRTNNSEQQN